MANLELPQSTRQEQNQSEQRLQRERGRFAVVSRLEVEGGQGDAEGLIADISRGIGVESPAFFEKDKDYLGA